MAKIRILVALLLAASVATRMVDSDRGVQEPFEEEFIEWMAQFNRTYQSPAEYQYRLENFQRNKIDINYHNLKSGRRFKMGVNQFSDYTPEEYMAMLGGQPETKSWGSYLKYLKMRAEKMVQDFLGVPKMSKKSDTNLKARSYDELSKKKVDWVDEGALSPIQNQGGCGSCWAFAAVAATEAAYFIKTGQLIKLSEQHMVDCSIPSEFTIAGCSGGFYDGPSKYLLKYGLQLEKDYPYYGFETHCDLSKSPAAKPDRIVSTSTNSIELLEEIIKGPVAIYIEWTKDMMNYQWDVFDVKYPCGFALNHAVVAVGFDVTANPPYIKIRNSHGYSWGERGYARLELRDPEDSGFCGIASDHQYRPEFN